MEEKIRPRRLPPPNEAIGMMRSRVVEIYSADRPSAENFARCVGNADPFLFTPAISFG
jgi:hypothetical protein